MSTDDPTTAHDNGAPPDNNTDGVTAWPSLTRRRVLQGGLLAALISIGSANVAADASTTDGDPDVGKPGNRPDLFADGVDANTATINQTLTLADNASQPGSDGVVARDGSDVYIHSGGSAKNISDIGSSSSYSDEQAQDAVGNNYDSTLVYDDAGPSFGIASGGVDTTQLATDAVTGPKIDLSTIAGQNLTVDAPNNELDASAAGTTQVATGTVTATGGSQPAVDTTLPAVSTDQTLDYWLTVHTESDPAFNADYAFNWDYYHQWDDSAGELDIKLIVNWDTDPGGGNDVTLRWEVLQ